MYIWSLKISLSLSQIPATPAAAERQERERPSERGGVISSQPAFSTDARRCIFLLPHEALP
ncbi:hypothetical protein QF61_005049 [Salmonella enterica subsp. enterica]|nr:hypothetical protein [Salmonella enterica subsp. enterica]